MSTQRHDEPPKNLRSMTVAEYNQTLNDSLGRFKGMNLAAWKLLQSTVISMMVFWLALETKADPTIAIVVIAGINGAIMSDLAALWDVSIETGSGPTIELSKSESANEDPRVETDKESDSK